ncbi:hypothetical protein BX661DRAFT_187714 [Kickxella alabastrina]|uniref:uncharacterized protein n=1 Tax=Kickxella alabastrina TaxID=61397 RepID=UPI002220DEDC|nr:uncharacterized protein BX661DRAFT_187714 [Kickxella alabastrina]KAI7822084.1 hypothetical protein BX661DRAFT_187714 [Kickxella alabastrina]
MCTLYFIILIFCQARSFFFLTVLICVLNNTKNQKKPTLHPTIKLERPWSAHKIKKLIKATAC